MKRRDLASQPLSICLWWGLPVAIGAGAGFLHLSSRGGAALCAALFAWMATGCLALVSFVPEIVWKRYLRP